MFLAGLAKNVLGVPKRCVMIFSSVLMCHKESSLYGLESGSGSFLDNRSSPSHVGQIRQLARPIERFSGFPQKAALRPGSTLNHALSKRSDARGRPRGGGRTPEPASGDCWLFTRHGNTDYLRSGWSRGHMAPAGDNKSSEPVFLVFVFVGAACDDVFLRLEMYCRDLTQSFSHVWIVSGPLLLPRTLENGSRTVCYQLIGKDDVAVPTHLYKVILAQNDSSPDSLALGAFVVPNAPIGFERPLTEFQVSLSDLERMSGLTFLSSPFVAVERRERLKNLCDVDSCQLIDLERFTLYISGRKVASARTLARLEKIMTELKDAGVTPDHYLSNLYLEKKRELEEKEEREKKPEP
ncbi:nuclease EXOG, mitochondrial-like [Cyprinus carpio]|uniref:Nuclease EXOG, mitochondrial-like n=1 Tax=Cyprinus carpio TaxID=7962 RepID=A0A9Q9VTE1_CYPCA|nr:nuclease EXOG, mitochondrial-like [Cyprinus carpio]